MNELQKEILNLWEKVELILKRENIKFWAIGGTAIGAFREKGFVPWDDDLDICVDEDDIDRMLVALQNEGFKFKDCIGNGDQFPFYKVFNEVKIIERGYHSNVFIDIFPALRERKWSKFRWKKFRMMEKLIFMKTRKFKGRDKSWKMGREFYVLAFAKYLLFFISKKRLIKMQWKCLSKKYINKDYDENYRFLHFLYITKFNISKFEEKQFEHLKIIVNSSFPKDSEELFGDIMVRPKQSEIWNHNIKLEK